MNQNSMMIHKDLFDGINKIHDTRNPSELEKRHIPAIDAPSEVFKGEYFEVLVKAGLQATHPNEPGHFIQYIDLYADDNFIARTDFAPTRTEPMITLSVALNHTTEQLIALVACNNHGVWIGSKPISVLQ